MQTENTKKLLNSIFGLFLVIVLPLIFYHAYYAKKIIPGIFIANVNVGGLTYDAAYNKIIDQINKSDDKVVILKSEDYSYYFSKDIINVQYNVHKSIQDAFNRGRSDSFWANTKTKIKGLIWGINLGLDISLDESYLNELVATIRGHIFVAPVSAKFKLDDKGFILVTKDSFGKDVDQHFLVATVKNSFSNLQFGEKSFQIEINAPEVSSAELQAYHQKAKKIIENDLQITFKDKSLVLTAEDKAALIKPVKRKSGIVLELNLEEFDALEKRISGMIGQIPKGNVVKEENGKVLDFVLTQAGNDINHEKFKNSFEDAFLNLKNTVAVEIIDGTLENAQQRFGINELLAKGTSKFTGSAAERAYNLMLASQRISGTLVPPGAIFSFNENVGEINRSTGYKSAYVISGGRTVLGDGGGVCQSSTTLFRAVLNAGLPVVQRNAHAYRVRYYEIEAPLGFDAAIYQPSLDFKFKNDTKNYILIQAEPNEAESQLTFSIYGTSDGRKVELSEPLLGAATPPPAPLYQDDPTLPKGVVKQVDFSAWGGSAYFTRTVKKDNEVLFEESFSSRYQPWRAVFLVGTAD